MIAAFALISAGSASAGTWAPAPMTPADPYSGVASDSGWYMGVNGGFLWMNDVTVNNLDFNFDTGWSALGVVGGRGR